VTLLDERHEGTQQRDFEWSAHQSEVFLCLLQSNINLLIDNCLSYHLYVCEREYKNGK
jgi:hypothetical protein